MLVQALAAYADTYLADQLADPAFEFKGVGYVIEIFEDGTFARLARRTADQVRGKKTAQVDLPLAVPKSPMNRNAVIYALPGCDAVQYLVGPGEPWTKEKQEEEKHRRQHAAFVGRVVQVACETHSKAWSSAAEFLRNDVELAKARDALAGEKLKNGLVTLRTVGRAPHGPASCTLVEEESFRAWWRTRYATDAGVRVDGDGASMCLVSGTVGPVAKTHDPVKGLTSLGGQPSGVKLMSFDKKAFQSYGWEKNNNSPVSPDRATAYVLALNDLIKMGSHRRGASGNALVSTRYDAGGTAFLFWTARPTDDDWGTLLSSPDDQTVDALFKSVRSGRDVEPGDTTDFFLAAVCGNGGRLVVRYWFRDSVSVIRSRLVDWFTSLRIADPLQGGETSAMFPLWRLLLATERDGAKTEDVAPAFTVELVRRAFQGIPLGHAILGALLRRTRLAKGVSRLAPGRVGLVRMCVNDLTTRSGSGDPAMPETLDENLRHPAYLCGRLLAVFDGLQWQAQGDVGVTVVDRYYALASTNPTVAFPKIEQLAQHHLKKLRRDKPGAAVAFSRRLAEMHEIIARQGARFPGQLSLEDQGRFAIGFHHQKAQDQARIQAAKAQKAVENASS